MPISSFTATFSTRGDLSPPGARIRYGVTATRRLIERRRSRRTHLELRILTTRGSQVGTVVALTLHNATLFTVHPLRRREVIALRLPSGRRIKARVRWSVACRYGIWFMEPVADFARLLSESRIVRSARRRPRGEAGYADLQFGVWGRWLRRAATNTDRLSVRLLRGWRSS